MWFHKNTVIDIHVKHPSPQHEPTPLRTLNLLLPNPTNNHPIHHPIRAPMTSTLRLGQILKGSLSTYTITKQLHSSVWLATYLPPPHFPHRTNITPQEPRRGKNHRQERAALAS